MRLAFISHNSLDKAGDRIRNVDDETRAVKRAKATNLYWQDVATYGSEGHALRALDCKTRDEAIAMLSEVQIVSVFKLQGRIVIQ